MPAATLNTERRSN